MLLPLFLLLSMKPADATCPAQSLVLPLLLFLYQKLLLLLKRLQKQQQQQMLLVFPSFLRLHPPFPLVPAAEWSLPGVFMG